MLGRGAGDEGPGYALGKNLGLLLLLLLFLYSGRFEVEGGGRVVCHVKVEAGALGLEAEVVAPLGVEETLDVMMAGMDVDGVHVGIVTGLGRAHVCKGESVLRGQELIEWKRLDEGREEGSGVRRCGREGVVAV